ncbi:MAG: hypothetical protein EBR27_03820 [Betaproteobacteria bacterium]|nr:hypothetical protein [Betaproteobacteria bacterium]
MSQFEDRSQFGAMFAALKRLAYRRIKWRLLKTVKGYRSLKSEPICGVALSAMRRVFQHKLVQKVFSV